MADFPSYKSGISIGINRGSEEKIFRHLTVISKPLHLLTQALQKVYGWILSFLALVAVTLQTIEHLHVVRNESLFYYSEVIFITLLLAFSGYHIRLLLNTLADRARYISLLDQKNQLSLQLSQAVDYHETYEEIVRFAAAVVPDTSAALYIHDEDQRRFELAASALPAAGQAAIPPAYPAQACQACLAQHNRAAHPLSRCDRCPLGQNQEDVRLYCLPFHSYQGVIGMLHWQAPAGKANALQPVASPQVELLEAVNNEITYALITAGEKKERGEQAMQQITQSVQKEIARDLHDTIAQNIGFLNMQLSHMAETSGLLQAASNKEIQHMQAVAEESYDLVRGTLAVLQTGSSTDLLNILSSHSAQIADRSDVQIEFTVQGQPKPLKPRVTRQLFYVFREALGNIEKHARASRVNVEIDWEEDALALRIDDNGRGFNAAGSPPAGHYGLKFMRDRIEQLNGSFSIHSQPSAGTQIAIRVPYLENTGR